MKIVLSLCNLAKPVLSQSLPARLGAWDALQPHTLSCFFIALILVFSLQGASHWLIWACVSLRHHPMYIVPIWACCRTDTLWATQTLTPRGSWPLSVPSSCGAGSPWSPAAALACPVLTTRFSLSPTLKTSTRLMKNQVGEREREKNTWIQMSRQMKRHWWLEICQKGIASKLSGKSVIW